MPEPCFLIVRLGSLGDIVHTFPAVAGLRESFPKSEIIWLTHPRWRLLVESSVLASQLWTVETRSFASVRKTIRRIRVAKFDAAIDYQGLWKSAALPFLGGVKKRIGFSSVTIREPGVPILYTDRVRTTATHIVDQNGELSLHAGARQGVAAIALNVPEREIEVTDQLLRGAAAESFMVLSPGGGWRSKCWPAERFGELAQKIHRGLGLKCVLNYGPGEENLVSAVKAASGDAAVLIWNMPIEKLMAVLRKALCIVGGDTGPLHLAVALGTPAVALFGPTDPARNGPYPMTTNSSPAARQNIVLRSPNAVTTYKRGDQPDSSLMELSVDQVFDAVRRQIGTPS